MGRKLGLAIANTDLGLSGPKTVLLLQQDALTSVMNKFENTAIM